MYTISVVPKTACIMLKLNNKLIDHTFINKHHFDYMMTDEQLQKEVENIAVRNNVTEYQYKGVIQ